MKHVIDRSTVHRHLVSDLHRSKSALIAAQQIESMIAQQGWAVGTIIGSEQTLRAQFGLGHRVGRETIRVLQSRYAIRARRGSHGGLLVGSPSRAMAVAEIADYLQAIAVKESELVEAQSVLAGMTSVPGEMTAIRTGDVFTAAIAEVRRRRADADHAHVQRATVEDEDVRATSQAKSATNGSARVAQSLLAEIERLRLSGKPLWLGSEQVLCERHEVGRPVLRQALRILESRGIIESHRGRFGGIQATVPSVRGAIETTLSYLSTAGLDQFELLRWTNCLGDRLNTFAVARWSDDDQRRTEALLSPSSPLYARWELWLTFVQWDACGNRILVFVARCTAAYQMRFVPDGHHISDRDLNDYQESLLERARAMSRRDLRGARDAFQIQSVVLERGLEPLLDRVAHA
jgi:DNA-binding FadR family transcriptional regulator